MQLAVLQCGRGEAVCTHCGTPGVCHPRVVQWTQQTTTVGVLCSCCPTPSTVRGQGEQGEGGWREKGEKEEGEEDGEWVYFVAHCHVM